MNEYAEQRGNYTENKVITRPLPRQGQPPAPVELLADAEPGLYGFRSPPATRTRQPADAHLIVPAGAAAAVRA